MLATPIPTREVCKILKTGQVTSYVDYDDAYYANLGLGEAKEYLVLDAAGSQYDGTTNITINGKTDVHSNNCVLDLKTGKMWSRYVSASVGPANDGKLPWTTNVNGEGIFPYRLAANVAGLALYTDWRVPDKNEGITLMNAESATLVPDTIAFPAFPTTPVWSSTTFKPSTDFAFAFWPNITTGSIVYEKATVSLYALLVRGGG